MPVERSIGCGLARADRGLLEAVAAISAKREKEAGARSDR
jgi:hypothetical protein